MSKQCTSKSIKSNKYEDALTLPTILNLNPRSIYNKTVEFKEFIDNHEVEIICMSESWERNENSVEQLLDLKYFDVISNVHQRTGRGGRPLIIANNKKNTLSKT